jgi:hypothetical protein
LVRNSDVYQVFVSGQLVHQEIFDAQNAALGAAALERAKKYHHNIMSLSPENRGLLMDKLFMQLSKQPGSQTVTLPWSTLWAYVDFPQEVPCKQSVGPAQEPPKSSTPPVPAVSANTPASNTASAPKTESDDDSPLSSLKSSTSKTPPTSESKNPQSADGKTKRKRKASTSIKPATNTSASDTKNARDTRQSSSKRRK